MIFPEFEFDIHERYLDLWVCPLEQVRKSIAGCGEYFSRQRVSQESIINASFIESE